MTNYREPRGEAIMNERLMNKEQARKTALNRIDELSISCKEIIFREGENNRFVVDWKSGDGTTIRQFFDFFEPQLGELAKLSGCSSIYFYNGKGWGSNVRQTDVITFGTYQKEFELLGVNIKNNLDWKED